MQTLVNHFAEALKWIDNSGEAFKNFKPGVGPYGEPQLAKKVVEFLRTSYPNQYRQAQTKRMPDILVPKLWAIEIKIVRPFGDNGIKAEHWSQNLLHPYEGNVSSISDALKLLNSQLKERKGIVVFTYEHSPPIINLELLVECFEHIAVEILRLPLGSRCTAQIGDLIHPVHQQATIYGWELNAS